MGSTNENPNAVLNEEALLQELISLLSFEAVTDALEMHSQGIPQKAEENIVKVKVEVDEDSASGPVAQPAQSGKKPGLWLPGVVDQKRPRLITADPNGARQLIDQQLLLCVHAYNCQYREADSRAKGRQWQCNIPHCRTLKNVFKHMSNCDAGEDCTVLLCSSYFKIIAHWQICTRGVCRICPPSFQRAKVNWRSKKFTEKKDDAVNADQANPSPADAKKPAVKAAARMLQDFSELNDSAGLPRRCLKFNDVTVKPVVRPTKDWHTRSVSDHPIRKQLMHELVRVFIPDHYPEAMADKKTEYVIAFARRAESEIYETANSRAEYVIEMAETVYELRKNMIKEENTATASDSS